MSDITPPRFLVTPDTSNHYAWIRTRLATERTFMAWVRTAVSLIGFGFTITQFFERLQNMESSTGRAMRPEAPRDLGLALIAVGVVALAISAWQYRGLVRYLDSDQFKAIADVGGKANRTPLFLVALVLMAIGVFAFGAVFFRMT